MKGFPRVATAREAGPVRGWGRCSHLDIRTQGFRPKKLSIIIIMMHACNGTIGSLLRVGLSLSSQFNSLLGRQIQLQVY
jgi:hypothetical protein